MEISVEKYRLKGWHESEIRHAQNILKKSASLKDPHVKKFEWVLFGVFFVLAILIALTSILGLTPLLLITNNPSIYLIWMIVGLGFGWLFSTIMMDLDQLKLIHHYTYLCFVLVSALGIFLSATLTIDRFSSEAFGINHAGWLLGLFYGLGFILPYYYNLKHK